MSGDKWFKPKVHTGWRQTQSAATRRRKLLASTDKKMPMRSRYLLAGKRIQALSNVNIRRNEKTSNIAKSDAKYFFKKLRKMKK